MEDILTQLITRAMEQNEITKADPRQLGQLLNVNLQGLMVKSKASTSKQELFSAIDSLFALLGK